MRQPSARRQAGKGDRPRNCFSRDYRDNYDQINWGKSHDQKLGVKICDFLVKEAEQALMKRHFSKPIWVKSKKKSQIPKHLDNTKEMLELLNKDPITSKRKHAR